MADKLFIGLILCVFLSDVANCGEYCSKKTILLVFSKEFYCINGCCGDYDNEYCCPDIGYGAGTIAGIVVGCLFLAAIIVGTIIAICCCLRRQGSTPGQIVVGAGVATTTTATYPNASYTMNPQAPYSYGQPQAPPAELLPTK